MKNEKDIRVTVNDVRRAGFCVDGLRMYCLSVGIDLRKFVKKGIPIEHLESLPSDANMTKVMVAARARAAEEQK